jgi:hypothetical protein
VLCQFSETNLLLLSVVVIVLPRRRLVSRLDRLITGISLPSRRSTLLAPVLMLDLTKYASHVYVLVRKNELRASKIMAKRLTSHPKVTVLWNVSCSARSRREVEADGS